MWFDWYYSQCLYCSSIIHYLYNLFAYKIFIHQMINLSITFSIETTLDILHLKNIPRGDVRTLSKNGVLWWSFWELVRKLQVPRQESCDLSFFKTAELFLAYALALLAGVVDRSEFTAEYSWGCPLLLDSMPLWKNMFSPNVACLPSVACVPHVASPCEWKPHSRDSS